MRRRLRDVERKRGFENEFTSGSCDYVEAPDQIEASSCSNNLKLEVV